METSGLLSPFTFKHLRKIKKKCSRKTNEAMNNITQDTTKSFYNVTRHHKYAKKKI